MILAFLPLLHLIQASAAVFFFQSFWFGIKPNRSRVSKKNKFPVKLRSGCWLYSLVDEPSWNCLSVLAKYPFHSSYVHVNQMHPLFIKFMLLKRINRLLPCLMNWKEFQSILRIFSWVLHKRKKVSQVCVQ